MIDIILGPPLRALENHGTVQIDNLVIEPLAWLEASYIAFLDLLSRNFCKWIWTTTEFVDTFVRCGGEMTRKLRVLKCEVEDCGIQFQV